MYRSPDPLHWMEAFIDGPAFDAALAAAPAALRVPAEGLAPAATGCRDSGAGGAKLRSCRRNRP